MLKSIETTLTVLWLLICIPGTIILTVDFFVAVVKYKVVIEVNKKKISILIGLMIAAHFLWVVCKFYLFKSISPIWYPVTINIVLYFSMLGLAPILKFSPQERKLPIYAWCPGVIFWIIKHAIVVVP